MPHPRFQTSIFELVPTPDGAGFVAFGTSPTVTEWRWDGTRSPRSRSTASGWSRRAARRSGEWTVEKAVGCLLGPDRLAAVDETGHVTLHALG